MFYVISFVISILKTTSTLIQLIVIITWSLLFSLAVLTKKQRYFLVHNAREDVYVEIGILAKNQSHVVQSHYVTQLPIHHYKSFCQTLLNQGHHNIVIPLFSIFMFIIPFPWFVMWTFVRFSKFPVPLVWKWSVWFIPKFSFHSWVRIFNK